MGNVHSIALENPYYRQLDGLQYRALVGTRAEILAFPPQPNRSVAFNIDAQRDVVRVDGEWLSTWTLLQYAPNNTPASADLRYCSIIGGAMGASVAYNNRLLFFLPGELRRVWYRASSDVGASNLVVGMNETIVLDTIPFTPGAGGVLVKFDFDDISLGGGDRLFLGVDPTNDPGFNLWWVEVVLFEDLAA